MSEPNYKKLLVDVCKALDLIANCEWKSEDVNRYALVTLDITSKEMFGCLWKDSIATKKSDTFLNGN